MDKSMDKLETFSRINKRGGGGDDYSVLESTEEREKICAYDARAFEVRLFK